MQHTMFAFEDAGRGDLALPLDTDQQQRPIELMAQAIEAVLQRAQDGEEHDGS